MTEVIKNRSILGQGPQFQPNQTAPLFAREISKASENLANQMEAKADVMYINSFLTSSRVEARNIFEQNKTNPDQLRQELDNYKKGLVSAMPGRLGGRLNTEYDNLAEQYVSKSMTLRNNLMSKQQESAILQNENQLVSDISFSAEQLASSVTNEKLTEEERVSTGLTAQNQLNVSFKALESNLNSIGADGTSLRTPEQIQSSLTKAKEAMYGSFAQSWLDSQPNKLQAYSDWLNDDVKVELPEGTINIRKSMSFETRKKVDKDLIASIKNDLYVDKQAQDQLDKQTEIVQDETKKVLFEEDLAGTLTPKKVDAVRNILEFDDFRDFSVIAREANPITNGNVYGSLLNKLDNGEDISAELRKERFVNRSVSNPDFEHLLNENKIKSRGANAPLPTAVKEGRNFLLKSLGSSAEVLSIMDSAVIARAERDYNGNVQDFIDANGREPNRQEALEISDTTFDRYNLLQTEKYAQTLPKPKYMPLEIKIKSSALTMEAVRKVKENTSKAFQAKHKGDIEAMKNDPELIEELKLIKQYSIIAEQNELKRAKRGIK